MQTTHDDESPTPLNLIRTGLRRRRLAMLAEQAAAKEAEPAKAQEHLLMARRLRAGAGRAFGKALRVMTFDRPAS